MIGLAGSGSREISSGFLWMFSTTLRRLAEVRSRCRLLHNFSPAYFTLVHANPSQHLKPSKIGDTVLSDDAFFADVRKAAEAFFAEVEADVTRQNDMNARLLDGSSGGAMFYD